MKRTRIDKSQLTFGEPRRIRDEAHRRFISTLPCCHCGAAAPTQAAHIRSDGAGGTGLKPSDSLVVPLSPACHARQHEIGETAFWGDVTKAKELAAGLYEASGDWLKAARLIVTYRGS